MNTAVHEYCYWLNSDDLYEPDLPLVKSKAVGGVLGIWRKWLDPFIKVHPVQSSALLPLVLQLPGAKTSVHVGIYLPTSGKDYEFISELANLNICLDELNDMYDNPVIFIRGDGNSNPRNVSRFNLFSRFISNYSLKQVVLEHPTYHHFVGEGRFDSNIDVILYSNHSHVAEQISSIMCKFDHPEISSHHDILLSEFKLPAQSETRRSNELVIAPRITKERRKVLWSQDSIDEYKALVASQLHQVRQTWEDPTSKGLSSVLLQATNHVLNLAASNTNHTVALDNVKTPKPMKTPHQIKVAKRKLVAKHRYARKKPTVSTLRQLDQAKKLYRENVRSTRLKQSLKRDEMLDTVLTDNPTKLYSFLRSCKKAKNSKIEKLTVGEKVYCGDQVGDGFYDAMSSLKSCNTQALSEDPVLSEHFKNYEHILKICQNDRNIPQISLEKAGNILKRLKKHVTDIFGITAQHYNNAGHEGLEHFACQLNCIISDVNNGTIEELNLALGLIL